MIVLKNILSILLILFCQIGYSQSIAKSIFTIRGRIRSQIGQETLIGAVVSDSLHQQGASTNELGSFALPVPSGSCILKISYVGYAPSWIELNVKQDTFLNLFLKPINELQTVEINAALFEKNGGNGRTTLSIEQLAKIPSIGGEKDLVKALTTLPGVAGGDEGTASMLVRGGGADQNLFILEGASVYNTGHLFGFISIFNSDVVKKVDLYKNAFPARFGGRLSSIVEVHFKEGNPNRLQGKVDIGVITAKLSIEGPITPKTSFLAAIRTSYLDLFTLGKEQAVLTPSFRDDKIDSHFVGYTFGDCNFKINHAWNDKHKTSFNLNISKDYYKYAYSGSLFHERTGSFRHQLTNATASIRSYHLVQPRFSWQWCAAYSSNTNAYKTNNKGYRHKRISAPNSFPPVFQFLLESDENYAGIGSIQNASLGIRGDVTLQSNWVLRVGVDAIKHFYEPNRYTYELVRPLDTLPILRTQSPAQYLNATEIGTYFEQDIQFSNHLEAFIGSRFSYFQYEQQKYIAAEPRFSLNYKLSKAIGTLNLSIAKMQQYQHALIKGGELIDRTVWIPSGTNNGLLKPQSAWQYALGWRKSTLKYDFSAEVFYKQMAHLSQLRPNFQSGNIYENWSNRIFLDGKGQAYGLELFIARKIGKLQGTVAYTWSKSERQFEALNDGKPFPFLYDRRHNAVLTLSYDCSKRWKIAALWTGINGKRFNLPVAKVLGTALNQEFYVYSEVNKNQFPFYHRLDLSCTWEKKISKHKKYGYNLNIYNAYFHKNIYFMHEKNEYKYDSLGNVLSEKESLKSVALFPIVPSINFFYHF
ncbi:MAG: hypothetical protein RL329_4156 [Bacteroidota bacterium]|jgi:hypothetical protein